jgi:hypothetical protein
LLPDLLLFGLLLPPALLLLLARALLAGARWLASKSAKMASSSESAPVCELPSEGGIIAGSLFSMTRGTALVLLRWMAPPVCCADCDAACMRKKRSAHMNDSA